MLIENTYTTFRNVALKRTKFAGFGRRGWQKLFQQCLVAPAFGSTVVFSFDIGGDVSFFSEKQIQVLFDGSNELRYLLLNVLQVFLDLNEAFVRARIFELFLSHAVDLRKRELMGRKWRQRRRDGRLDEQNILS